MELQKETVVIAAGVLGVALVAAYLIKKAGNAIADAGGVGGVASNAAGAVVDAASGAATGTVIAMGEQFGIPATSQTQCDIDMAAGNTWAASFSCPLPIFAKYLANGAKPPDTYTPVNPTAHGAR